MQRALRSQIIVVSDDHRVVQACRDAGEQTSAFVQLHQIMRPQLLPKPIGLGDWVVLDLDCLDLQDPAWAEALGAMAGQTVATSSDKEKLASAYRRLKVGRRIRKKDLDRQLRRLVAGAGQAPRFPDGSRPGASGSANREHKASGDVAPALRLAEFAQRIALLDGDRIVEVCLEKLSSWFQVRRVSLYALDERHQRLTLLGKTHPDPVDDQLDPDHQSTQALLRAAQSRQIVFGEDRRRALDPSGSQARAPRDGPCRGSACVAAPIALSTRLIGVLELADPLSPSGFDNSLLKLLAPVCNLIAKALNNARLFQEIRRQARTDDLTGLVNRRTFTAQLNKEVMRARRYGTSLVLIMIDMDGLKDVNDTYGHPAGDAVLRVAADRILATIREIDTAARFGGDEFAVILPNTALSQANHVADRLAAAMARRPCRWRIDEIPVTFSVGLAEYGGQSTTATLIESADAALYAAKAGGKNCVAAAD